MTLHYFIDTYCDLIPGNLKDTLKTGLRRYAPAIYDNRYSELTSLLNVVNVLAQCGIIFE